MVSTIRCIIREMRHLLSAGDLAQSASDVCETWTLFSGLVPARLDQIDQRLSKFCRLWHQRPVWDALTIAHTVHDICNDNTIITTDF